MDQPEPETTGMPRWVKVFGITAVVLILLLVVLFLVSGGEHGPGRHLPGNDGDQTPPGGVHTPPAGGH